MQIFIKKEYVGSITGGKVLPLGPQEIDDEIGKYLLSNRPDIAALEGRVTDEGQRDSVQAAAGQDKPVKRRRRGREDNGNFEEWCCGKRFWNQGSLNLHRRNRSCPNNPKRKD